MNNLKLSISRNLKPYSNVIPKINKTLLRSILKVYVAFLEHGKYSKEVYDKELNKVILTSNDASLSQEDYAIMFSCLTILMETLLKLRNINSQELIDSLKELKFSDECFSDLTKVFLSNQQTLCENFIEMKLPKPMEKFQYRINISILAAGQSPTIIFLLEYKGQISSINLSMKHFHTLRLVVATILAEVYGIEGKRN